MTQLPTKTKNPDEFYFAGFKSLNSTPIPDEFFDVLAVRLSEAELRVLLYIMRRTFGFKKTADAISLSQLTDGIRRRDGSVLDNGTGLSRPSVLKAVTGLQTKGIIAVEKHTGPDGRNEVNVYSLRFQGNDDNNLPKASFSHPAQYSITEYYGDKQSPLPIPDPRFVSAQPLPFDRQPGAVVEQRRSGAATIEETARVRPVYYQGKEALPEEVSKNTRGSQTGTTRRVKMLNPQHDSLQILSGQSTIQQQYVLRSAGSLALQVSNEPEPVEVEIDGDLLYINFRKLVSALVELGLSERTATALGYDYPEAYLWEKIELTRRQLARSSHQTTVRNTAGYLRRAIEEDYQPQQSRVSNSQGRRFPYAQSLTTNRAEDDVPTGIEKLAQPDVRTDNWQPATGNSPSNPQLTTSNSIIENFTQATAPLPPIYRASGPAQVADVTQVVSYSVGPANAAQPSGGAEGGRQACYADLWEQIKEDLGGRFRLERLLPSLEGAWLWLEDDAPQAVIILASEWQSRQFAQSDRSAVGLAVRQRLGPGYSLRFEVGTS